MNVRNSDGIGAKIDAMFGTGNNTVDEDDVNSVSNGDAGAQGAENDDNGSQEQTADSEHSQRKPQAARDANADEQSDPDAGEGGKPKRGKEQQQQREGAQQRRGAPANANGDLIDPATGAVIARAGKERRFFETARAAQMEAQRIARDLEHVSAQLDAYERAAVLPKQLGLSPNDVTNAMQFMAHWKKNPVEAAQNVLTELRAMGYEVEGMGGAVDMAALKRMVNEAIAPFQQDRENVLREQEVASSVDRELNGLYAAFPWTQHQQQEMISLMEADQTLTLREAALHLQAYALQHGFDLNKPLRPQVLAAQNDGQQQQQQRLTQQRPNNARIPAPSKTGDTPVVPRRASAVGHEASTRDLVKDAMREAGFNVENL